MSIANKLTYLNDTREKIRTGLNKLGAGILPDDTFRSYADTIEDIYDSMPKVEVDDVESATLEGTIKGGLDINPKGNTSQDSTTGKNLVLEPQTTWVNYQSTNSITDNKITVVSTTASMYSGCHKTIFSCVSGKTYTFSVKATGDSNASPQIRLGKNSDSAGNIITVGTQTLESNIYNITATFTATENFNLVVSLFPNYSANVTATANFYEFQLEESNSQTSYEPYTGGIPAPNPSYPQQIHEVSGDNEIVVFGKNLLNLDRTLGEPNDTTTINTTKRLFNYSKYVIGISVNNYYSTSYITSYSVSNNSISVTNTNGAYGVGIPLKVEANKTYKLSYNTNASADQNVGVGFYSSDGTPLSFAVSTGTNNYLDITTPSNCDFMVIVFRPPATSLTYSNIMLNEGSSALTYEPYNGDTYELDLGVENLFNINGTHTDSYCTSSVSNGELTQTNSGTYSRTNWEISNLKVGEAYTISYKFDNSDGANILCQIRDSSSVIEEGTRTTDTSGTQEITFTATETTHTIRLYSNGTNTSSSAVVKFSNIQLEEGSKANSFSPYGITPIKMRGIGTYDDYFTKNTGKNLLPTNISTQEKNGVTLTNNGDGSYTLNGTATANGYFFPSSSNYQHLKAGTYTFSSTNYTSITYAGYKDNSGTPIFWQQAKTSFTLSEDTDEFRIQIATTNGVKYDNVRIIMQLEQGNQGTLIEPYGTGQWCKYNAIGKVVLDGTQTINFSGSSTTPTDRTTFRFTLSQVAIATNYISDRFIQDSATSNRYVPVANSDRPYMSFDNNVLGIVSTDSNEERVAKCTTYLITNNVNIIYPITPYLSLIEDNNLIEQLDNIQNAISYEGQTNVSQENNDLPLKLDIKAILDWRNE